MSEKLTAKEHLSSAVSKFTLEGKLVLAVLLHEIYYRFCTDNKSKGSELCSLSSTYYSAASQFSCRSGWLKPLWLVLAATCYLMSLWLSWRFTWFVPTNQMTVGQIQIRVAILGKLFSKRAISFLEHAVFANELELNCDQNVLLLRELAGLKKSLAICEKAEKIIIGHRSKVEILTQVRFYRTYAQIINLDFFGNPKKKEEKLRKAFRLASDNNILSQIEKIIDEARGMSISLS